LASSQLPLIRSATRAAPTNPLNYRPILEGENPDYRRNRPIAILNCKDINAPADLARGAWCWVKMTEPTLEGLRQAFLDPGSRIRLATDPEPEEHVEFVGIAWETEGFLRGSRLHFNENLNVLIGGRGSGKSTVIESIRYVLGLEPVGADARKIHDGIVNGVLRSGTGTGRLLGNFPQALSHIALINSAFNLSEAAKPAMQRSDCAADNAKQRVDRLLA